MSSNPKKERQLENLESIDEILDDAVENAQSRKEISSNERDILSDDEIDEINGGLFGVRIGYLSQ